MRTHSYYIGTTSPANGGISCGQMDCRAGPGGVKGGLPARCAKPDNSGILVCVTTCEPFVVLPSRITNGRYCSDSARKELVHALQALQHGYHN